MRLKLVAFLWNALIIIVTVIFIHLLENLYTYSQYNYDSFFSVYSDNIGKRSQFEELSPILPIDVVYTWVNGSDTELMLQLREAKQDLIKKGLIAEMNISGEGHIYSKHRNPQTNETSLKCLLKDCVPSKFIVFETNEKHLKVNKEVVINAFPDASTALRFITIEEEFADFNKTNFIIAEIIHDSSRERILRNPRQNNIIAQQAYLTTTTMIEEALPWSEAIVFSNLQPNMEQEHQLSHTLPTDASKGLVKVEVNKDHKIALMQFLQRDFAVDSLNYYYQNPAVLGQVQVGPCSLLWDLENVITDPEWLSPSRFADNEELRYSLRSVEKFAPWVRHIFIVTNGQVPAWLNLESSRLTIVTHAQIFPPGEGYLPTFSSPAIESQLHKIPGLAKHFLYFNDDVMLGKPVFPQDFFTHQSGYKIYSGWPVPPCKDECPNAWIHDGYCDAACNNAQCEFDGGDCRDQNANNIGGNRDGQSEIGSDDSSGSSDESCAVGCTDSWLGDKYCDSACNKRPCGYDAGDCGLASLKKLTHYRVTASAGDSVEFIHSLSEKSFVLNLTSYSAANRINASDVTFQKSRYVRTVKMFASKNLIEVILKHTANPMDGPFAWPMQVKFGDSKDEVRPSITANFTFKPALKGRLATIYLNKSAEVGILKVEHRQPTILANIPLVPSTHLVKNITKPVVSAIEKAHVLPKNVTTMLNKVLEFYANKTMTHSVFEQVIFDIILPYQETLENFLHSGEHLKDRSEKNVALQLAGAQRIAVDVDKKPENIQPKLNNLQVEQIPNQHARNDEVDQMHMNIPNLQQQPIAAEEPRVGDNLGAKVNDAEQNLEQYVGRKLLGVEVAPGQINITSGNSSVSKKKRELTKDTFKESLRFVNKLYDKEFGSSGQRMVIAHMPHFINKEIMTELQTRLPAEFERTAKNKVRMGNDMQFAFSYFQYIISVKKSSDYLDVFEFFDSDKSGVLSDRELRVLATYIYPTPISLETMNEFENNLRECANSRAQSGVIEDPPRNPETYYSQNMPQITALLLFNCRIMLDKITSHFSADMKYKHEIVPEVDNHVMFKMLPTNLSSLITMLDEVRHNRKKFICLNDNFDHQQQDAPMVRAVIQDFYEGIYPIQSQFELPREYRNRFLHLDELDEWQSFRWKLKLWSHVLLGVLVVISIGSFIQEKMAAMYAKVAPKRHDVLPK